MAIDVNPSRCFWCQLEVEKLTEDHIIPRSMGGTRDYTVGACAACQAILSKAELEVSRKSILAISALTAQLPPRHRNRPTSGNLQPTYFMVKHPYGGYGESLLSAGEQISALPHIEIKVVPNESVEVRVRGAAPADVQKLLDTFRGFLKAEHEPGGLVCELTVNMDLDPRLAADPDFWPRIILLPGDRLMVRARDVAEAMRFNNAFMQIALSDYQVDADAWGSGTEIKGGTEHTIALNYDHQCVRRVAAKIAYGLFTVISGWSLPEPVDEELRQYILGKRDHEGEPVTEVTERGTFTTNEDPHLVVISSQPDGLKAFVCLYGWHLCVDLGPAKENLDPFGISCEIDGKGMRKISSDQLSNAFHEVFDIQLFRQEKGRTVRRTETVMPRLRT